MESPAIASRHSRPVIADRLFGVEAINSSRFGQRCVVIRHLLSPAYPVRDRAYSSAGEVIAALEAQLERYFHSHGLLREIIFRIVVFWRDRQNDFVLERHS